MKKVIVVLLLVAIMVLSMTGCSSEPDEVIEVSPAVMSEDGKLEFKPKGTYNLTELWHGVIAHRFDSPNEDIVVYELAGSKYLVGDNAGKTGTSYASMFIPNSEFIALSNKYILFSIENQKVAYDIEVKKDTNVGTSVLQEYLFDELSDEEKDAFIYPVSSETINR